MDDRTLIKKLRDGDKSAVGLLVENNKNLVWHIIISMTGRNTDNEDLFQEVFLQVLKGISRFRADARISTWIGSITHNVCVDHLRKKKRESDILSTDGEIDRIPRFTEDFGLKNIEKNDLNQFVLNAISMLPVSFRMVITLYHLDECSYQEIVEITGMPDGTVKSYINRGRKMLRENLLSLVPDLAEILDDN